jgi:hypothetical protein
MKISNLITAAFFLFGSIHAYLFYTGKTKLTPEKEKKRREIVEKYGWPILASGIVMFICSLGLFLNTLSLSGAF